MFMEDAERLTNFVAEIPEGGGIEVLTSDGPVTFTLVRIRGKAAKRAKVLTQTKRRNRIRRLPPLDRDVA